MSSWRDPTTFHLTRRGAHRARRRYLDEVRGRDSYVHLRWGLHLRRWETTRIGYRRPTKAEVWAMTKDML